MRLQNQISKKAYLVVDLVLEVSLYFLIIFSVWNFGTTSDARQIRTDGWCLWLLPILIFHLALGRKSQPPLVSGFSKFAIVGLIWINALALLWCLISASNAAASFDEWSVSYTFYEYNENLPHTFSPYRTSQYYWSCVSLTLIFWSAFAWLRADSHEKSSWLNQEVLNKPRLIDLPPKFRRLLWVLVVNGAALGIVSILQRLAQSRKLLFILESFAGDANTHFGPFNYRGNGAQYFNMLWPVAVGLYWLYQRRYDRLKAEGEHVSLGPLPILIPVSLILILCPVASLSRGGTLTALFLAPILIVYFMKATGRNFRTKGSMVVAGVLLAGIIGALFLTGETLLKRIAELDVTSSTRLVLFEQGLQVFRDHFWYGVGPGAYRAVVLFYCEPEDIECAYIIHNDYIQVLAEWGMVGAFLLWIGLGLCLVYPFATKGGSRALRAALLVALVSMLIQAIFDVPFFVWSLRLLFVVLLALYLANGELQRPGSSPLPASPKKNPYGVRFG